MLFAITTNSILGAGLVVFFVVVGSVSLPRYWRGDPRAIDAPETWGLMTPGIWRGTKRAAVVMIPTITVMCGLASVFFSVRYNSPTYTLLVEIAIVVMVVGFSLITTITLFNRPRFLVPPAMRADPGLLAERRAGKRTRRGPPTKRSGAKIAQSRRGSRRPR